MSKTIRLTYYGVEGEGPTVTAAKHAAGRKLEHLVSQTDEAPTYIEIAGVSALVFFQKSGWGHCLLEYRETRPKIGRVHQSSGGGERDRHEAEIGALRHVLDIAWNWPEDDDAWFTATMGAGTGVYPSPRELQTIRGEFLAQCKWQRDYRRYRGQGYDDEDARYLISGLTHLVKKHPAPATNRPGDAAAVLHHEIMESKR